MNELELKNLWQSAHDKLEVSIEMNKKNAEDISRMKVRSLLGSMKPMKILVLLLGAVWVGVGTSLLSQIYLHAFSEANKFFLFSASIQIFLTAIALWVYVYQLITINMVDVSEPVVETQKRLIRLKMSTLWVTRILFLQLPVWTTFWWNESMLADWNLVQWILPVTVTVAFTCASIWLFFNIKYENRNRKWFQLIFNGKEWTPLMKSMELLEQVETREE